MSEITVITDTNLGGVDVEREILAAAGIRTVVAECRTEQDVIKAASDATALLVQFAPVTPNVFNELGRLRAVVRYGTGLDNVDLRAAAAAGVAVFGVDGYCIPEVAEHTIALLLSITRGVVEGSSAVSVGEWKKPADFATVTSLHGLEMAIVGFGKIGRAVAQRAQAFGLAVGAYDPYVSPDEMSGVGVTSLNLEDAFRSRIVSLHLPLTPDTVGVVSTRLLGLMPSGSILLNVSRGALIDEPALIDALDQGRPMFAGLDVLGEEPATADHPLVRHPRTLITPHIAFYSATSIIELRRRAAETVVRALQSEGGL